MKNGKSREMLHAFRDVFLVFGCGIPLSLLFAWVFLGATNKIAMNNIDRKTQKYAKQFANEQNRTNTAEIVQAYHDSLLAEWHKNSGYMPER